MTAWGGLLGTLTGFSMRFDYNISIIIFSLILLSGIIASSRLKLNAHTPFQVYSGFTLGFGGMISLFFIV
jgi:membrane-associated phospholipid phosphatase